MLYCAGQQLDVGSCVHGATNASSFTDCNSGSTRVTVCTRGTRLTCQQGTVYDGFVSRWRATHQGVILLRCVTHLVCYFYLSLSTPSSLGSDKPDVTMSSPLSLSFFIHSFTFLLLVKGLWQCHQRNYCHYHCHWLTSVTCWHVITLHIIVIVIVIDWRQWHVDMSQMQH